MKKSKLITLLSVFTKEEMKRFEKFIASPYYNNGRNFKPLYKILKSYHPSFNASSFTEEKIFKKLYPGKDFDKKSSVSLRVLESQMSNMAERFLETEEFGNNLGYRRSAFLQSLNRKGKTELVVDYGKKFLKELEIEKTGFHNLLSRFLVRQEIKTFYESNSIEWEFQKDNVVKSMDSAFLVFVSNLIWFYETVSVFSSKELPESKLLAEFENHFNFENFMSSLKKNTLLNSDYLQMLYYSYKTVSDRKDHQSYENLKALLLKNIDSLSYYEKYDFIVKLINFCSFQQDGDIDHYNNEYIENYYLLIKFASKENRDEVFSVRAIRNFARRMIMFGRIEELKTL